MNLNVAPCNNSLTGGVGRLGFKQLPACEHLGDEMFESLVVEGPGLGHQL